MNMLTRVTLHQYRLKSRRTGRYFQGNFHGLEAIFDADAASATVYSNHSKVKAAFPHGLPEVAELEVFVPSEIVS
jgi:hypothetical protein